MRTLGGDAARPNRRGVSPPPRPSGRARAPHVPHPSHPPATHRAGGPRGSAAPRAPPLFIPSFPCHPTAPPRSPTRARAAENRAAGPARQVDARGERHRRTPPCNSPRDAAAVERVGGRCVRVSGGRSARSRGRIERGRVRNDRASRTNRSSGAFPPPRAPGGRKCSRSQSGKRQRGEAAAGEDPERCASSCEKRPSRFPSRRLSLAFLCFPLHRIAPARTPGPPLIAHPRPPVLTLTLPHPRPLMLPRPSSPPPPPLATLPSAIEVRFGSGSVVQSGSRSA